MHDAPASCESSASDAAIAWRELFRCDDLKLARAVATSIAAMEFDVRLCSINPAARDVVEDAGDADNRPGPHVIEVAAMHWHALAGVLGEIIEEQREFDRMLEWRRERNRVRLVIVLSIGTAAEVALIWRLLEA